LASQARSAVDRAGHAGAPRSAIVRAGGAVIRARRAIVPCAARSARFPAVLCVHGHWAGARMDPVVQSRCIGLATGNLEAGKQYFDLKCVKCHSATGDLKGIASRFEGLHLEEQMLYPREAKSKVTITLPSGKTVKGTVAYQDEWTIGIHDENKAYRSWKVNKVRIAIDPGLDGHVALFPQYSDADIHNLTAYLVTLK